MSTCIDELIGLSPTIECECITDPPTGYNNSDSGVYLTDAKGLNLFALKGVEDCRSDMWQVLNNARQNAILQLKINLQQGLTTKLRSFKTFSGVVGSYKNTGVAQLSQNYAGFKVLCKQIKNGKLQISQINTYFNFTGTISLNVRCNYSNSVLATYTLNTTVNSIAGNELEEILELPMYVDGHGLIEYYFTYSKPVSGNPYKNYLTCGCGGWDMKYCENCFTNFTESEKMYNNYIALAGFETNTLTNLQDTNCDVTTGNGLTLTAKIVCDSFDIICKSLDDDVMKTTFAYALLYKSAQIAIQEILNSQLINTYTILNRDQLYSYLSEYQNKYGETLAWICENIDTSASGCYECKQDMKMGSLL